MADEAAEAPQAHRERILALHPDDRAGLARLMRKQLDRIPTRIARLHEDEKALTEWLTEFAPELLPPDTGSNPGSPS